MWAMIAPPTAPERPTTLVGRLLRHRSVQIVIALWVLANVVTVAVARGHLPFDRPAVAGSPFANQLIFANLGLVEVLLIMALTWYLTRRRQVPDMAARAPDRDRARRETFGLIGYGVLVQIGGALLGTALGWRPISFHLAGTIYGTHAHITRTETITWALYNLVLYAVVPYLFFRRRYSNEQLNLRSTDRRNDLLVVVVILVVESIVEVLTVSSAFFDLTPSQMLIGAPLAFVLYFVGTVLPTMIFIYAILLPRYLKLTGAAVPAAILGGVTYTLVHFFDAWLVFGTVSGVLLSMIFLFFQYFGPGLVKSTLTLRTGNAWVHAIAYHAVAPHVLVDGPHVVHVFGVK
jgi:hypothetical protein